TDVLREQALSAPAASPAAPAPAAKPAAKPAAAPIALDRSIFRAYDIRGVVGTQLTKDVARLLGQAIGNLMREKNLGEIAVGRDGRLSGAELVTALGEGLRDAGCAVIDLGAVPTPLVYFATYLLNTGCGVAVTGSHNPPEYNGFKIVVGGETLSEDAIQDLYARISEGRLKREPGGSLRRQDLGNDYIDRIAGDVQLERPLKVVVDCGNGIPGAFAPQLLQAIGAEVIPLYCEVDGTFPNHHPDPSDPHNLADLMLSVKRMGADLGLAFDGDGDRLGVVTPAGDNIFPDRLLMLFAADVLTRDPGATVIYDVKCTGHLAPAILRHGGVPLMWRTGHSLIKAKMRETEAALAGEMSGHFFFRERWYGFDDGMYAACRLLEILAADAERRAPGAVLAALPQDVSTPELKIPLAEGEHYAFIERFRAQARFEGGRSSLLDGVRVDWPDGFGLVRASNTTPVLVLRFAADSAAALARIQAAFRAQLLAQQADLKLPF
ncbi:phosphomannomutase/phosphoglucomutase, partial [Acidiphilium sp.]|uniref:phosphomannomutase/phosphoglucomutase n=1 Tax=Acidiphilium sp. TaxID=527 RepID=UPI00258A39BA